MPRPLTTWQDQRVVVTGAARGIGAAVAERLLSLGARVVVTDLLEDQLRETADRIGAQPISADISTEDGVRSVVSTAREHLSGIDVWIGNAGVARGAGLDAPDTDWETSWSVNVMAHVRAARLLLPEWLERGSGRFVVTASAAGLLTVLGQPSYAVTKHGAESFAEWLAVTYGHRGIDVHAICPQGVRTDMYPGPGDDPVADVIGHDGALEPADVADVLVRTLATGDFLVLPHPEVKDYFAMRGTDTDKWLRGMQRLQERIDEAGESR
ncbi:dehydrogenase [Flexivirga endophytica]|uniref:Dehydrogenase n=1 Tax=Flexivirga endophytica TaxID=1849103 RepID=A0A916T1T0_9MICO|nr:SDR family oxidoreductase [Flexivirga endophytica]GGB28041.1 dehydrogenase [Flexivirga endophytica]GHB61899.1 dehydrogenase [Flexivirga endophytica]